MPLTDRSRPLIIHRFSNFLTQASNSKLDHTHLPKYRYQGGVGLGIFAAALDICAPPGCSKSLVVCKCTRNDDQMMMKTKGCCSVFSLRVEDDVEAFTDFEYLTCCNFCRTELSGKDIYMYRGEKAFCSEECREVHIAKDEKSNEDYRYIVVKTMSF